MLGYKQISFAADECSNILRWMCGNTKRDKMKNKDSRTKIDIAHIEKEMRAASDGLVMCDVNLQMH